MRLTISNERGQGMAEFAIVAITFLFVILGVIQLAMVLNAATLVQYAAYNAARAAVVNSGKANVIQEAARVSLLPIYPRHGRADHLRGLMENYLAAQGTDTDNTLTFFGEPITEVKILNMDDLACGNVITFDDPTDAEKAYLTVQVVHRYELVIPLVNRILFWVYTNFRSGTGYEGETLDYISKVTDKRRRSGDFADIEYRIPLVAHYTMRLQSDYAAEACPPPPPPPPAPPSPPPPPGPTTTTTTTTQPCTRGNFCGNLPYGFPDFEVPAAATPPGCLQCCPGTHCEDNIMGHRCYSGHCDSRSPGAACYCY